MSYSLSFHTVHGVLGARILERFAIRSSRRPSFVRTLHWQLLSEKQEIYQKVFPQIQFSSVTQLWLTLCNPMNRNTPGLRVHHQLPEFTQTHVSWVDDAIQSSHSLPSPSLAFNLSQHQGLFKWVSSSHQMAQVLEFQLQHQSFQWIFRTDFL